MNNKTGVVLFYLQISLYTLKIITYAGIAIFLFGQIELKEINAPEDIMLMIDGPLGRMLLMAAILESIHNFIGMVKRMTTRNATL